MANIKAMHSACAGIFLVFKSTTFKYYIVFIKHAVIKPTVFNFFIFLQSVSCI